MLSLGYWRSWHPGGSHAWSPLLRLLWAHLCGTLGSALSLMGLLVVFQRLIVVVRVERISAVEGDPKQSKLEGARGAARGRGCLLN